MLFRHVMALAALVAFAFSAPAGAGDFYRKCGYAPRRGKVYRGVPLLYFELMTHLHQRDGGQAGAGE